MGAHQELSIYAVFVWTSPCADVGSMLGHVIRPKGIHSSTIRYIVRIKTWITVLRTTTKSGLIIMVVSRRLPNWLDVNIGAGMRW